MAIDHHGITLPPLLLHGTVKAFRGELVASDSYQELEAALRRNPHLWAELQREAAAIANGDPRIQERILRFGGEIVVLTARAYEVARMETQFAQDQTPLSDSEQ